MAFKRLTDEEFRAKMDAREMTHDGKEIPDPKPFRPSLKVTRSPSMFDYHRLAMDREREYRRMVDEESPDDMLDLGEDDEDMIETLSEYEQADLQATLAREEARSRASAQQKPADAPEQAPPAPGQGAKPGEAGGGTPPLTKAGEPAT